jgi:Flp pilus assembly protein TadG
MTIGLLSRIQTRRFRAVEIWPFVCKLAMETEGAALVEFTVLAPILLLLAAPMMSFGLYYYCQLQVNNAAQAGAQYAIENTILNGYNASSIQSAATHANTSSVPSFFTAISATSTRYCGCPTSSGVTPTTTPPSWSSGCATGTACSDGSYPGTYVAVIASATFTPLANYESLYPSSWSITSKPATVRVQ